MKRILLAVVLLLGVSNVDAVNFESGNSLLQYMKNCDQYEAGKKTYDNYFGCGLCGVS